MLIHKLHLSEMLKTCQFSSRKSFCQIATISKTGDRYVPHARTVLLYHSEELEALYFTCSVKTAKWQELQQNPIVTGIVFSPEAKTQYRFEAEAELIGYKNTDYQEFYHQTWSQDRPDLRHELWRCQSPDQSYDISTTCPLHGVVLLKPYYWDIFKLSTEDFAKSKRTQMILCDSHWDVYDSSNLHPMELSCDKDE